MTAFAVAKVAIAAVVLAFCAWLAGRRTELAGFIVALPVASLLVLPLAYWEWGNSETAIHLGKSIMVALPFSLLFFAPFFVAERFDLGFWHCYAIGVGLLLPGYGFYRLVMGWL